MLTNYDCFKPNEVTMDHAEMQIQISIVELLVGDEYWLTQTQVC